MNSLVKLLPLLALLNFSSSYVIPRNNDGGYKTDKSMLRPETYQFIEANAKGLDIPGFTAVITTPKGDEIWSFGKRDKQGTPNDPKTFFALASDSKLIGGVTLATLQEQGYTLSNGQKFEFTSLMKDVDPSYKMVNETATNEATVLDVLAHFDGLPGHNWSLQPNDTNADAFARLAELKPNLGFRELWQYSNLHYQTLGHIVDRITGGDYYQLADEIVFKPLGMEATNDARVARATGRLSQGFMRMDLNSTQCGLDLVALNQTLPANSSSLQEGQYPTATLTTMFPESCLGRQESMEFWTHGTGREWGAGGDVIMTGEDILKWIKEIAKPQHFSQSVIDTVNTGHVNNSNLPSEGTPSQYGIGSVVGDYQGYFGGRHDGALPGSNSYYQRIYNESIGVFVITSEDQYNLAFTPSVAKTILDDLLGLPPADYFSLAYAGLLGTGTEGSTSTPDSTSSNTAVRRQAEEVDIEAWVGKSFVAPGYLPFTLQPLNLTDVQGTLDTYGFPAEFITTDISSLTGIPVIGPALIAHYGASFCSHMVFTHFAGPLWNVTGALVWDRIETDSDAEGLSPKIAKLTGAASVVFGEDGIGMFDNILTANAEGGIITATTENTAEVAPLFYAVIDE